MPGCGGYHHFWEADPRRWERCKQQALAQMQAEGFQAGRFKFEAVVRKRALKLWKQS